MTDAYFILGLCIVLAISICGNIYAFIMLSPKEQQDKVREWLVWAVIKAEATFGGGIGKIKLRAVYDMFITKFPWLVRTISFDAFSDMVDQALMDMRDMLETNSRIAEYVSSGVNITAEELLALIKGR